MSDLRDHVERIHAAGQSRKTSQARVRIVGRLTRDLRTRPAEMTTRMLESWLARPGWSRATRSIYRYHIRAYFTWLHELGRVPTNPAAPLLLVRVPKRPPRPVASGVLRQLLARADYPYRGYFLIALYGGLRCAEIAGLHTEDVTQDLITVRGKGGKVRLVDTHPLVWEFIASLAPGPVCHLAHDDEVVAAHRLSNRSSAYLRRLGFKGVTLHRFRHTFATQLLLPVELGGAGTDIAVVKELLGHESVATTAVYTLVSGLERRRAVRALPAF